MGTWGEGPFDNDGASDFVDEAEPSPAATIATVLRRCAEAPPDEYLDVDDGQQAIAAAEVVALAFGLGRLEDARPNVRALIGALGAVGPSEELRVLAIAALRRVRVRGASELASLWAHDPTFDARLGDLLHRLVVAGAD